MWLGNVDSVGCGKMWLDGVWMGWDMCRLCPTSGVLGTDVEQSSATDLRPPDLPNVPAARSQLRPNSNPPSHSLQ